MAKKKEIILLRKGKFSETYNLCGKKGKCKKAEIAKVGPGRDWFLTVGNKQIGSSGTKTAMRKRLRRL